MDAEKATLRSLSLTLQNYVDCRGHAFPIVLVGLSPSTSRIVSTIGAASIVPCAFTIAIALSQTSRSVIIRRVYAHAPD